MPSSKIIQVTYQHSDAHGNHAQQQQKSTANAIDQEETANGIAWDGSTRETPNGGCLEDGLPALVALVNNHGLIVSPQDLGLSDPWPKWPNFVVYKWVWS